MTTGRTDIRGKWPMLWHLAVVFCLLMGAAGSVAAQDAKALAKAFDDKIAGLAGTDAAAQEAAYLAMQLLDRIVAEHPGSLEARLLTEKGRLPHRNVDLPQVYLLALQWEAAHPDLPPTSPAHPSIALAEMAEASSVTVFEEPGTPPAPSVPISGALTALRPGVKTAAPSVPKSVSGLLAHLREVTVLLYFVGNTKSGGLVAVHVGSGSFIGPDLILTNAHVAEGTSAYSGTWLAINEKIGVRAAKVVSIAPRDTAMKIDAAVMRVEGFAAESWLVLNRVAELDEHITIAGYPGDAALLDTRYRALDSALVQGRLPDLANLPTALVNEGRINNFITSTESNALELQYTMVTAPGNSGSPVVNDCGELVGLHYSGGATAAKIKFNGAVHARDVALYLQAMGLGGTLSDSPCAQRD